jgi:hypothetical protein
MVRCGNIQLMQTKTCMNPRDYEMLTCVSYVLPETQIISISSLYKGQRAKKVIASGWLVRGWDLILARILAAAVEP